MCGKVGHPPRVYELYGGFYYDFSDNVGTPRVIIDEHGNKCYDADYFPWGGEQAVYANSCPQNYKFTGQQRDPDTSSDYFGARWFRYTMARFYSPDWSAAPEAVPYAKLDNPQSQDLYTYVLDNPLRSSDPDGHDLSADPDGGNDDSSTGQPCQYDVCVKAKAPPVPLQPTPPPTSLGIFHTLMNRLSSVNWSQKLHNLNLSLQLTPMAGFSIEGEGAELLDGAYSEYDTSITVPGSVKNVGTDVSVRDFGQNLEANGFAKSTAADGTPIYTKGNTQYTVYSKATSTGSPTAQVKVNGEIVAKIRLQP